MDQDLEGNVREVFVELSQENTDISKTLESQIVNLLTTANDPLSVDMILSGLDMHTIVKRTLRRLETRGIVHSNGTDFYMGSLRETSHQQSSIPSASSVTEGDSDILSGLDLDSAPASPPSMGSSPGSSDRRARMRKEAFTSQSPSEEKADDLDMDSLFDDALGESIEDFVSDFADLQIEETKTESGVIEPLVDMLREYNYIDEGGNPTESLEYRIMLIVLENYPIKTEDIESSLDGVDSLSLLLSNLKADDFITQTNDYRYTITKKIYKALKDYTSGTRQEEQVDEDREHFKSLISRPREQFVKACFRLSYLYDEEPSYEDYKTIPEFEVLDIVKEHEPVDSDKIKTLVDNTLPVVVSRMLSKLHADGIVATDSDNRYITTTRLYYYMVKDILEKESDEDTFEELQTKYKV